MLGLIGAIFANPVVDLVALVIIVIVIILVNTKKK